ncbi:MAG: hypothetical protein ABFS16_06240 [Bacteroidota bacterium]
MKAIILISSIFYILGLKISHKINLVKKCDPVDKVITNKVKTEKPSKSIDYNDATKIKPEKDTISGGGSSDAYLLEDK